MYLCDKMFKILPHLVLLAVVNCQMDINSTSLEKVMEDFYVDKNGPSTLIPAINSGTQVVKGEEDLSCTMRDGTIGQCISYFLCDTNHTIVDDGAGVIDGTSYAGIADTSAGGICASYLDICCVPREVRPPEIIKPSQSTMDEKMSVTLQDIIKPPHRQATEDPRVIHGKNDGEEHISCTMDDGTTGQCVAYYKCDNNNTIVEDGTDAINIRASDSPCASYLDVCCLPRNIRSADNSKNSQQQPASEGCGWRNPRGVDFRTTYEDAEQAKFGEFPWMVGIMKIKPANADKPDGLKTNLYLCGGSLIAPNVALTIAHRVADSGALRIRAGEWDIQSTKEIYPFQDRDVSSVEVHKDFNKGNLHYDVALLFLSEPVTPAPNVGVACLPPPEQRTPAGTQCFATGWGKDKYGRVGRYQAILKKVELPVVERNACQTALRNTRLGRFFQLHTSFMCAGGEEGKGTCKGDEGSPLSCPIPNEEGRYMQSGIVAWGIGCGEKGIPSAHVDVAIVRDWIDDKMISKGFNPRSYTT